MPVKKLSEASVSEGVLLKLREQGVESDILECRLAFTEAFTLLKYLNPLKGAARVHPNMLPTQASGRWSTTNPPIVNWAKDCISPTCGKRGVVHVAKGTVECWSLRDIVVPDEGTYWIEFDWNAIEAVLGAAFRKDGTELEMFMHGLDVHTMRTCKMFGLPPPPSFQDPSSNPECAAWRESVGWQDKDDPRRLSGKAAGYACEYGSDKKAILKAHGVEQLGMTREELLRAAELYLKSKPELVAFKRREWQRALDTREARTFLGRRRRLYFTGSDTKKWYATGIPCEAQREALNHKYQGSVADVMDLTIIAIKQALPASRITVNAHDGLGIVVPDDVPVQDALGIIRPIVEREWDVHGQPVRFKASFGIKTPDGVKEKLG